MFYPQQQAFTAFRHDPLHLILTFTGYDLTEAEMDFAIRQYRDQPGDPALHVTKTTVPGGEGIRVVSVTRDADDVPTSLIEIIGLETTMVAMSNALPAAERGADLTLAHDFQWKLPPDASGLTSLEETILWGDFILKGSVND